MKLNRIITAILAFTALGLGATTASAALIDGELGLIGTYVISGGSSLDGATELSFPSDSLIIIGSNDFAAQVGESVTISDISLASPSASPLFTTSAGLSYTLTSLTVDLQTANALDISGMGMYSLAGFDDTAGTFTLTADSLNGLLTFSASSAAVVPVPGALILFATSLLALRRRSL